MDVVLGYRSEMESPHERLAVGTMTRPLVIASASEGTFIGVRFWPGRAYPFFRVPASELTDLRVDVADLWRADRGAFDGFALAHGGPLVHAFERLLQPRLARAQPVNPVVDAAIGAIARVGGNLSIAALGPALGVTRQYLARAFALHVGVPPKMFARIMRVRRVLARARVAASVDWGALALDTGYFDQAHLAGEVKELTGRTPTEWSSRT